MDGIIHKGLCEPISNGMLLNHGVGENLFAARSNEGPRLVPWPFFCTQCTWQGQRVVCRLEVAPLSPDNSVSETFC